MKINKLLVFILVLVSLVGIVSSEPTLKLGSSEDEIPIVKLGSVEKFCSTNGCTINGDLIVNGNVTFNSTTINMTVINYDVIGNMDVTGNITADAIFTNYLLPNDNSFIGLSEGATATSGAFLKDDAGALQIGRFESAAKFALLAINPSTPSIQWIAFDGGGDILTFNQNDMAYTGDFDLGGTLDMNTNNNIENLGNITGTDVDIDAGTGDYVSTGNITAGFLNVTNATISSLINCDTINTTSDGTLICGTDGGGTTNINNTPINVTNITISSLINCDTINTTSTGQLICGTDGGTTDVNGTPLNITALLMTGNIDMDGNNITGLGDIIATDIFTITADSFILKTITSGTIEATSTGAFAGGNVDELDGGTALITANTNEAPFAWGFIRADEEASSINSIGHASIAGGFISGGASGFSGIINASGNAARAWGAAQGTLNGDAIIKASGAGSEARGGTRSNTVGFSGSLIASGAGSTNFGRVIAGSGATVDAFSDASGIASFINTYINKGNATASGDGASIFGDIEGIGSMTASGDGSNIRGTADDGAIEVSGDGAYAGGISRVEGGLISATDRGGIAHGAVLSGGTGFEAHIISENDGAIALGSAWEGFIEALGEGSLAGGVAWLGGEIKAGGAGSLAWGRSISAGIFALAENSVQFLEGTNPVANSFKIGNTIHFLTDGTGFSRIDNLAVVDPTSLGAEKITNGDFAVDPAIGGEWTLGGTTTWNGGTLKIDFTPDGTNLQQASADMVTPLIAGEFYAVTFTISNWGATQANSFLRVSGGGTVAGEISAPTTADSVDGTYTLYFGTSTTDPLIFATTLAGITLSLDDISLKQLTDGSLYSAKTIVLRNLLTTISSEDSGYIDLNASNAVRIHSNVTINENLNVIKNITSENVFIPQYIFTHNNATIPVIDLNEWTNITFDHEDASIKQGINHTYNDATNHTFTITQDGIYSVNYNFDIIDTSVGASDVDIAGRLIFVDGTEIVGSVFETDIIKQEVETELSHTFLANFTAGNIVLFQFVASDVDVQISTHGTFGDNPESTTIIIQKIANLRN